MSALSEKSCGRLKRYRTPSLRGTGLFKRDNGFDRGHRFLQNFSNCSPLCV